MEEEKRWTGCMRGRFLLGENLGEPGPGLGPLYEAWRAGSGRPGLVLLAGEDVEWRTAGPWRVILSCEGTQDSVSLDVERAPTGVPLTELANLLLLMSATVERVEDHPRVQAHLASGSRPFPEPWTVRARRTGMALALAGGGVFALGLCVGRMDASPPPPVSVEAYSSNIDADVTGLADVVPSSDGGTTDAGVIAYPLPAKPFGNQSPPPCKRREAEFNGGCWQAIDQRPPCDQDILEHQGKCFIPVAKRPRLPQSVEPNGQ